MNKLKLYWLKILSVLAVIAIILGIYRDGGRQGYQIIKSYISEINYQPETHHITYFIVIILIIYILYLQFIRIKKLKTLAGYGKDSDERFESISVTKYCAINFYPTLIKQDGQAKPSGVGFHLLKEIFGDKDRGIDIEPSDFDKKANWNNIFSALQQGDCDIVATPLYETRERLLNVAFTSPIFYAEIGLYINKSGPLKSLLLKKDKNYNEIISFLKNKNAKTTAIKGELHTKLAIKTGIKANNIEYLSTESEISDVIKNLWSGSGNTDFVFAEKIYADRFLHGSNKHDQIVNVLNDRDLLFPVGFALRKTDATLRRFINLRLLELEDDRGGIIQHIANYIKTEPGLFPRNGKTPVEYVKHYFVREPIKINLD